MSLRSPNSNTTTRLGELNASLSDNNAILSSPFEPTPIRSSILNDNNNSGSSKLFSCSSSITTSDGSDDDNDDDDDDGSFSTDNLIAGGNNNNNKCNKEKSDEFDEGITEAFNSFYG